MRANVRKAVVAVVRLVNVTLTWVNAIPLIACLNLAPAENHLIPMRVMHLTSADDSRFALRARKKYLSHTVLLVCGILSPTNERCPEGQCCSPSGQCGTTTTECGTGCQEGYGSCGSPPGVYCPAQNTSSLPVLPRTPANTNVTGACPPGFSGTATAVCDFDGVWGFYDTTGCRIINSVTVPSWPATPTATTTPQPTGTPSLEGDQGGMVFKVSGSISVLVANATAKGELFFGNDTSTMFDISKRWQWVQCSLHLDLADLLRG